MTHLHTPTEPAPRFQRLSKGLGWVVAATAVGLGWMVFACGCAHPQLNERPQRVTSGLSPRPEVKGLVEGWQQAEAFAAGREDAEVVLGLGESMEPLYHGRTLLVIERQRFETLAAGMTVVFTGGSGRPVAHLLVRPVPGGWEAAGLANAEPDATRVTARNYRGTVTKAFELIRPQTTEASVLSELRQTPDRSRIANFQEAR